MVVLMVTIASAMRETRTEPPRRWCSWLWLEDSDSRVLTLVQEITRPRRIDPQAAVRDLVVVADSKTLLISALVSIVILIMIISCVLTHLTCFDSACLSVYDTFQARGAPYGQ